MDGSLPTVAPPPLPPPPFHDARATRLRRVGYTAGVVLTLVAVGLPVVIPRIQELSSPCHRIQAMLRHPDLGRPLASRTPALDETLFDAPGGWSVESNLSEDLDLASRAASDIERIQLWRQKLTTFHFTRGWRIGWLPVSGAAGADSLRERVLEFTTAEDAQSFQRWASEDSCRFAAEAFQPPGVAGSVGLRFSYGTDGQVEQASFVVENRRYMVVVGTTRQETNRSLLLEMLRYAIDRVTTVTIDAEPCREIQVYGQQAVEAAAHWGARPIGRLEPLVPARAPLGFSLVSTNSQKGSARFSRTWTDGVSVLKASVVQLRDTSEAAGWLRKDSAAVCERAAAVADSAQIPGSVFVIDQEPTLLIQRVVFVRGSRGYVLELQGPSSETPGDIIRTLASRAAVVAR